MRFFYTDHFELPLPDGHRFPMSKYQLLRRRVVGSACHQNTPLIVPAAATDAQLTLAHTVEYVHRVVAGELTPPEIRRIGFPWSPKMVERSRRSTGATIAAATAALEDGISANLAGGTHHAFPDAGEGYCVFNDAAVAIRTLQQAGVIKRACVIDCDVHQGNGTHAILAADPSVFTLSIHGEKNFPLRKVAGDLDVELRDGTDDDGYTHALQRALEVVQQSGPYDLAIYLAGADPFQGDRLGRLGLSKSGLRDRDQIVLRWCTDRKIPVAIAMAGGYAPNVDDIVDIHAGTLKVAQEIANAG
ncbi:MAG: histone deacetylase [Planctomycetota bacterium]